MNISGFDVEILGFHGVIESVNDVLDNVNIEGSVVQLLNARGIAGRKHILHAVNQSILAFNRSSNFANDLGVEICLRCSAQTQISKAFDLFGLKECKMDLCAVVLNGNDEIFDYLNSTFNRDDDVLIGSSFDLVNMFNISSLELNSFNSCEDIIIDRISRLSVDY